MMFLVQWWLIGPAGGDARVAGRIRKAQHRVGVRDVQIVAHQRHAERRVQPFEQHRTQIGHAVSVGVAQQCDAVRAGYAGTRALHDQAHHPADDSLAVFGLGRSVGLGHQHVAVGQRIKPARVVEAGREGGHAQAGGGLRCGAGGPALRRCDVDGRDQRALRCRQDRLRPGAGRHRQRGHVAASRQRRRQRQRYCQRADPQRQSPTIHQIRPITSSTTTTSNTSPNPPLGP